MNVSWILYFFTVLLVTTASLTLILTLKVMYFFLFFVMTPVSSWLSFFLPPRLTGLCHNHLGCKTQWDCGLAFDISRCNCYGLYFDTNPFNGVISHPSIFWVIITLPLSLSKLLRQIWHFSAASCSLFNTSVSSVIGCCRNNGYNCFILSSLCSENFSTQSLSWYIFNGSRTSP